MSNLGVGVMISRLSGNSDSVDAFLEAKGKEISELRLGNDDEDPQGLHFVFTDGSKIKFYDDGQSCCESRYMRTDDDLSYYVGSVLMDAEIAEAPSAKEGGDYGEHEVEFLRITTSKGVFTMSNHNEHNGYYGGFSIRVCKE